MNETRVVLVEDSTLLREGLVRLLGEAGFEVAAAVGDAEDLPQLVQRLEPDVVLLDIRLPPTHRDEGVRAAIQLRQNSPTVGVLLLSQYVEPTYARELLTAGAQGAGYLLKDRVTDLTQLHDAVTRVAAGGTVLDPELIGHLLRQRADPLARLTPREHEVLALMAEGRSNTAIAHSLVISAGAIEKHITNILRKLDLEHSPDAHRRVLAVLRLLDTKATPPRLGPTPPRGRR